MAPLVAAVEGPSQDRATGGGWPVDLYLDYVRGYKEAPWPREPAGAIAGVGVSPGSRVMTFLDHSVARGEPT
ncbi:MAG: hypothetical protein JO344_09215 [Planctomycetaceae bacterium]|nr:hypothetical protein [Planctomycetaceae bacterium]